MKTVLLTVLTLSCFVIALVELSGISNNTFINRCPVWDKSRTAGMPVVLTDERTKQMNSMPKTTMEFTDTKFDFGTITEGTLAKHAYHFKNTGSNPLLIAKAEASCGCTVPQWPKEPIPPGGEGDIVVQFNSEHRVGHQQKNVMIHSNAQMESISIGFSVDVKAK